MDFRNAVITALDEHIASGKIEEKIAAQLETTIANVISSELQSYGDFGKKLTAAVKKSLEFHDDLDLPSYNHAILQVVRRQIEAKTNALIQQQVAAQLEELLEPVPAEITLSDLVAKYIERLNEEHSGECVCYGDSNEITLEVKETPVGDVCAGYREVILDPESNSARSSSSYTSRRSPAIRIAVNRSGVVYALYFRDSSLEGKLFAGPFYGFERMLFQMRAAGTKLVFDKEPYEIDKAYGRHENVL